MDIFQALAEPRRREIVKAVALQGQLTAGAISQKFKVSKSAISQHLKVLHQARILHMEKWGRERIYQVELSAFGEIEKWLAGFKKLWHGRLDRLGALFEVETRKIKKPAYAKASADRKGRSYGQ